MCCIYYILQNVLGGVVVGGDLALVIGLPAIHSCSRLKKIDFFWGPFGYRACKLKQLK